MFNQTVCKSLKKRGTILRIIGFVFLIISFIATIYLVITRPSHTRPAIILLLTSILCSVAFWLIFDALALLCYGVGENLEKSNRITLLSKDTESKLDKTTIDACDTLNVLNDIDFPDL